MNKKQRLDEWIRRLEGFPEYDKAVKGLRREFRKEKWTWGSLLSNDFNNVFYWENTKEGFSFWDGVDNWLINRDLNNLSNSFPNPVRELIAKAKAYPELAELAKRAEESL